MFNMVWVVKDFEGNIVFKSRFFEVVKFAYDLYTELEGRCYFIDYFSIS